MSWPSLLNKFGLEAKEAGVIAKRLAAFAFPASRPATLRLTQRREEALEFSAFGLLVG